MKRPLLNGCFPGGCYIVRFKLAKTFASLVFATSFVPGMAQPFWSQYAGNAQHTATDNVAIQRMNHVLWSMRIDNPANADAIHYGTPLVSAGGNALVTVRMSRTAAWPPIPTN